MGIVKGGCLEKTIFDMKEGEEGFTSSKALELHFGCNGFLYLEMPISKNYDPKKKKILYVKRIGDKKDDFLVDLEKSEKQKWSRSFILEEDYKEFENDPGVALLKYEGSIEEKYKNKEHSLEIQLKEAEKNENYELAAKLRDEIRLKKEK
ncbi:MAG: UvrB/UvrC motif-containing protein [Nanoarchaeota archaeon]|nr:UvrB/UvrC motif-containing protein [Nanoarchaeota archaeon]